MKQKTNIFLTGAPSAGKTTVIKRVIEKLPYPAKGFYTEEERIEGRRSGFMMHTLDGQQGYLAHQDIVSNHCIRRYGVSIETLEALAVPAILPTGNEVIILDEIGKMECFSEAFIAAALNALDAPNIVIGTIAFGGTDFIREVKKRDDITLTEVTLKNRDQLPEIILRHVETLLQ